MLKAMLKRLVGSRNGSLGHVTSEPREPTCSVADLRRGGLAAAQNAADRLEAGTDLDAAADFCSTAVSAFPADPKLRLVHANVLADLGQWDDARLEYEAALAIAPGFTAARFNLGVLYQELGQLDDAIACHEQVLASQPDAPQARLNIALARLARGEIERGWEEYAIRFHSGLGRAGVRARKFDIPEWQGECLEGKRLLVWAEQGLGDQIVFASLYPDLLARAGRCDIECNRKLVALFARSFPGATVLAAGEQDDASLAAEADYHIAAGSLGRWLRPDLAAFPSEAVFLQADSERVAYWRGRLEALGPGRKVGICWRSSNANGLRALACTDIAQWRDVLAVPGAHFVNLQYDRCSEELARARSLFGTPIYSAPGVDLFDDLLETSALMSALDLVISAPTVVSMHAAALGVPTWQLSCGMDWQRLGTPRNPWFPAMRPIHRDHDRSWDQVLGEVARELHRWARSS
jgi:tetratricopeptide (TPR) repeat protein